MRTKNKKRSSWALVAVKSFQLETGLTKADGLDTAIADLLADIRHLCDLKGFSYADLDRRAYLNYLPEVQGIDD